MKHDPQGLMYQSFIYQVTRSLAGGMSSRTDQDLPVFDDTANKFKVSAGNLKAVDGLGFQEYRERIKNDEKRRRGIKRQEIVRAEKERKEVEKKDMNLDSYYILHLSLSDSWPRLLWQRVLFSI